MFIEVLNQMCNEEFVEPIGAATDLLSQAAMSNKPILICGNGGSAADSMHIAGELTGRFLKERRAIKAISLASDSATITFGTQNGGDFVIGGTNLSGTFSSSLDPSDISDIEAVFGNDARGSKEAYVYGFFTTKAAAFASVSSSVDISVLPNQDFTNDAQEAQTPYVQSQLISGRRVNLLRFETIGAGNAANTKVKVGITNIKPAGSVAGTDYGVFTVVIRAYSDTNRRKVLYETYSNVTMDPSSVNYIYRVIGDRHITIGDDGKVTETGDWANKSKYVRLVNSERDSSISSEKIPVQAVPFGHAAYKLPVSGSTAAQSNLIPAATFTAASETTYGGIDLDGNSDNKIYMKPLPIGAPTGSNTGYFLDGTDGFSLTGSVAADVVKRNFIIAFQDGFDGTNPTVEIKKGKKAPAKSASKGALKGGKGKK
jgi:hypothetical protein